MNLVSQINIILKRFEEGDKLESYKELQKIFNKNINSITKKIDEFEYRCNDLIKKNSNYSIPFSVFVWIYESCLH